MWSKSKLQACVPHLSNDVLLEILHKLPFKSAVPSNLPCKQWDSCIISNPMFMHDQYKSVGNHFIFMHESYAGFTF